MKIDYAVMSSDDNELYLDFWEVVAPLWHRLGITPVLLYFGNKEVNRDIGMVVDMKAEINLPLATCWARYWWVGQQKDKISIITDIDMLPFSEWYFNTQIQNLDNDSYVHLNPCIDTYSRLPSCYHVANGYVYKNILKLDDDFGVSYMNLLHKSFDNSTCYIKGVGNDKWCYDEYYASELILSSRYDKLVLLNRDGGQSGHRLDRTEWRFTAKDIINGYYFDCHSARPYKSFKHDIDWIVKQLVNTDKK